MPPSSLSQVVELRLKYPLLFQIESYNDEIVSHCGVLEFEAEEGSIYLPEWMMKNLKLQEGDLAIILIAAMLKGGYIKLQPHKTSFIEVSDPRAVLEKTLRSFTCLTRGDTIMVTHNKKEFYIDVLEEPEVEQLQAKKEDDEKKIKKVTRGDEKGGEKEFRSFTGMARRLDGEAVGSGRYAASVKGLTKVVIEEKKIKDGGKEAGKEKFKAFTGRSYSLGEV
ncbi:hypothetical protein BUALT_Bualt05G0016000 [Buddleja alternifolia]|uniref:Ubiquitin fusion degradaton protein n=1 Tax=Buddleja alternifolia TaxID=168488 RepID=A0AAV6XFU8_9LAMI|nr:hypothetical protein BUALT_Bualt05G0016000 [Buddleja alternifolia]